VAAIAAQTGIAVRVLSGTEEATFAALGVISGFYRPGGVIGDMGGGSLELAGIDDDRVAEGCISLPLGALPAQSLLAQFGENAKSEVDAILAAQPVPALPKPVFYPVGGGWRALAKAHMMANPTPVNVVHGYRLDAREARSFAQGLWRMNEKALGKLKGVPARRAKTLAAAALVLDRVLKRLAPEAVVFSALGVREGWLYQQLAPEERYFDPLVEGAQDFATPLARVPGFAAALEDWTATLFPGETPMERRLRVAACALSDVGWRDHSDWRAAEWFRRLVQFPFIGLDHAERVFLAASIHARYAGCADDAALSPAIGLLSPDQRRRALVLGRTMQLGYRLSGGVPQILSSARVSMQGDRLLLRVGRRARVPDSEAVSLRLQSLADAIGDCRPMIVETPDE
jgi:exopolyphosphatase/guanosine-5'-triphosphate,3'-diphosphate pyrophosphatase